MIISKIELFNWKNFHRCEVGVQERCFVVGANAQENPILSMHFAFCGMLLSKVGDFKRLCG